MMRPRKHRHVRFNPEVTYFKPRGIPLKDLKEVNLGQDELEAVRLKYVKGLNQHECAENMKISQSTFQRLLLSANQKISEALIKGKAIRIEKGKGFCG